MDVIDGTILAIRFGPEDLSKAEEERLLRKEVKEKLSKIDDLEWKVRQRYVEMGSPCGTGVKGLLDWIKGKP